MKTKEENIPMQTLNYSKQILEFFENSQKYQHYINDSNGAIKELLTLLDQSIKFILPERGEILASYDAKEGEINAFQKEWVDLMFLPFPIASFEIPFTYHSDEVITEANEVPAEKRVALCWNPKHDSPEIKKINQIVNTHKLTKGDYSIGEDDSPDGFCIVVFFQNPLTKEWLHTPAGAFFPYSLNVESDLEGRLYGREINLFPFYTDAMYKNYNFNMNAVKQQIWHDLNHEVWSVLQVCCVLNCDNISTRTIEPSLKQQKSRQRKGLKPLYSYKVLTVKATGTAYENMYSTEQGGSKRTHFRRGHLRRLPNKTIWVRPAIVGANNVGTVDKDYRIEPQF